jgi:hypothetical protein
LLPHQNSFLLGAGLLERLPPVLAFLRDQAAERVCGLPDKSAASVK